MGNRKALLVVSFGSTVPEALETIQSVENAMKDVCSDRDFFRAFSSTIVRRRLAAREVYVQAPSEVLETLSDEGYTDVLLQPTHLIPGSEFDKVKASAEKFISCFESLKIGSPLVHSAESLVEITGILRESYPLENNTALLLMGHGTEHLANFIFPALQTAFRSIGMDKCYVATVEGWPALEDAVMQMKHDGVLKVLLAPFLLVAGDHVIHDMIGEEDDSWKNVLESAGFCVECRPVGLGKLPGILNMYRKRIQEP